MDSPVVVWGLILLCLVLSALFSGIEIAFLSSNKLRLELDRASSSLVDRLVQYYLHRPNDFIAATLVGNNVVLVVYGMLMAKVLAQPLSHVAHDDFSLLLLQTLISTFIVLILAEFLPKAICKRYPNTFLRLLVLPHALFYFLFYPVSRATTWLAVRLIHLITGRTIAESRALPVFGRNDLNQLVGEVGGGSPDACDADEQELKFFRNALEFGDTKLRDCLVPRTEIVAMEINTPMEELLDKFVETSFSRIPIFRGNVDNIVGYVNAKNLFKHPESIESVLRAVEFVPETMQARKLLSRFIKTSLSMAIVVDEFGGTAGLVTIEDLLEEIFGEINDEHDTSSIIMRRVAEGEYLLSGRAEVEEVNERFGLQLPESESYDTVAGFILAHHPDIPEQNDVVAIEHFSFRILRVHSGRIVTVRLSVGL